MIVPGAISLHTLHKMLQVVMGWENAHVYVFRLTINEKTIVYGLPDPEWESLSLGGFCIKLPPEPLEP